MRDKVWIFVVIIMLVLLFGSSRAISEDFASWLSNWAIAIGLIYIIVKNRNK